MPNRYIREGINSSRAVASLDAATEVFYRRMINVVDDFGRFEVDTLLIRSQAFPVHSNISETDIRCWLTACEKAGLIVLYEVSGRHYLALTKTERPRAKNSRYPEPSAHLAERRGLFTSANSCPDAKTFAPNTNTNTDTNTRAGATTDEPPPLDECLVGTARCAVRPASSGAIRSNAHAGPSPVIGKLEVHPSLNAEILGENEAVAQTATAGIPPDFARFVYQDWSSRNGKDGAGVIVSWLPYVSRRWSKEQIEWKAGTHRGKKGMTTTKLSRPVGVPTSAEVFAYAREKWVDDPRSTNWAVSFFAHWNDSKREWKRNGYLIDWKIELTNQVAKWRIQ